MASAPTRSSLIDLEAAIRLLEQRRAPTVAGRRCPLFPLHAGDRWRRVLLVTGHARGGTTWLGHLLSLAEDSGYLFEPLTHTRHPTTKRVARLRAFYARRSDWMPDWPPASLEELDYAEAIGQHILELFDAYYAGPLETLILKQPGIKWVPLLAGILRPEKILYIKRHPAAILNSYDKSNLYLGWGVSEEFRSCFDCVAKARPDLLHVLAAAGDDSALQVLSLSCLAHAMADEWSADPDFLVVNYEDLASQGPAGCVRLCERVGLRLSDGNDRLASLFTPQRPQKGFLDTEKNSQSRSAAYVRELAPWQIAKIARFLRAIGYADAVLRPSVREALLGTLEYAKRRSNNFENFLRSRLSSLRQQVAGS